MWPWWTESENTTPSPSPEADITPPVSSVAYFPLSLNLGWHRDLLLPMECSRMTQVQAGP